MKSHSRENIVMQIMAVICSHTMHPDVSFVHLLIHIFVVGSFVNFMFNLFFIYLAVDSFISFYSMSCILKQHWSNFNETWNRSNASKLYVFVIAPQSLPILSCQNCNLWFLLFIGPVGQCIICWEIHIKHWMFVCHFTYCLHFVVYFI